MTESVDNSSPIISQIKQDQRGLLASSAQHLLGQLVQEDQYVGELWSITYETAVVQIHDYHRQLVGGIPNQCFLLATRLKHDQVIDYSQEDSAVILLRVLDAAAIPGDEEAKRIRAEAAQRASGSEAHWDDQQIMDAYTANFLSFAGVRCRVIGTFYLEQTDEATNPLRLKFGSDLSNYYPNRGLKIYKPKNEALNTIVNYRDFLRISDHPLGQHQVNVGRVRYASTDRGEQGVDSVRVHLAPADLISQKTALFGMTRTGKSNTTKIIAKSIFDLRFIASAGESRIGQLIFDFNGEYANENTQDGTVAIPTALKNVWRSNEDGVETDVVTFGSVPHPNDPGRVLMKINFYGTDPQNLADTALIEQAYQMVPVGKDIINQALDEVRGTTKYINNFVDVDMACPEPSDRSSFTRYRRALLAYRALLFRAGLEPPTGLIPSTARLFNQDFISALQSSTDDPRGEHANAARILSQTNPQWGQIADAFNAIRDFINRGSTTGYTAFNQVYMQQSSDGSEWHDQRLEKIIEMFKYINGPRSVGRVVEQHDSNLDRDYADLIYEKLVAGKLVIVDQSAGDSLINRKVADRVMIKIFKNNQTTFSSGEEPQEILIYIEEAHNLLPSGSEEDYSNIWVRTAKEGAKLKVGLVYATQEVSSIQKNILKNTANWFIGHLNNTDETRELKKYYDFEDFEPSIRRAQDRGFLRVKTLSNLFVVPAQIDLFNV